MEAERRTQLRLEMPEKEMEQKKHEEKEVVLHYGPGSFDYERFRQEAMEGLRSMEKERADLKEQARTIAERITILSRNIDSLRSVCESFQKGKRIPAVGAEKRLSRVKMELEGLLPLFKDWTDFDAIAEAMRKTRNVKNSSIRSAIDRLMHDGILLQDPPADSLPRGARVAKRWKVDPAYMAYQETARAEAASQEEPELDDEAILAAIIDMLRRRPDGLVGRDLAWLATEEGVDVERIERIIASVPGVLETAVENGQNVLRIKADPGSKEELKRTKLEDRPLFPDMDRPSHA